MKVASVTVNATAQGFTCLSTEVAGARSTVAVATFVWSPASKMYDETDRSQLFQMKEKACPF
jgi:hypothetical protein